MLRINIILLTLLIFLMLPSTAQAKARDFSKAVIHHSESPCWTTVEDIDRWHKEQGWDGIGYHLVIYCDGSVHPGRDYKKIGAHAKGRNERTGICLIGKEEITEVQIGALRALLKDLEVKNVERHHERCPGAGVPEEVFSNGSN